MRPDKKSKTYVRALLKVAGDQDAIPAVGTSLRNVVELLRQEPVFKVVFHTRRIPSKDKLSLLRKTFAGTVHPIVLEFLILLVEERETMALPDVAKRYTRLQDEALNQIPLMIYSSEAISDDIREDLIRRLEASTGKTLKADAVIDPSLLGGIKLRLGNLYLDASLSKQLDQLKQFILK
ncbi:MAG: ATP synthase F1 subunit delta [FCB group bacterium]|nr:ATP synthase F1 subunit delta [FCB group bacterium]